MTEIAILSGKGGTGKSSLSAALATLASKVVVADCDVDAANLHLVLHPDNYREETYVSGQKAVIDAAKCSHCGACMDYCRFDAIRQTNHTFQVIETACDGCQLCTRVCPEEAISMVNQDKSRWFAADIPNGKMIHARLAPGEDNSGRLVNLVRDQAREAALELNTDLILIDGPPGIGCPAISSLTGIDKVVLVSEPSKSGIHDLKRIVKLAQHFRVKIYVVINKYDLSSSLSKALEDWCQLMRIPIIGKLPFDRLVVDAMVNGESITNWAPDSAISHEIRKIWNKLIQHE
ncbi:P-loop NTPase [uncultured Sunxiuqinia sp.]|uniref:nucleotide-binding protein n=1 Tax=uncultured Sunxiuqinia sp. TaxID=1573825 RepID=UPI0026307758|nr:P-loop NTPase [uncultured Sunxiuqinia sp.]